MIGRGAIENYYTLRKAVERATKISKLDLSGEQIIVEIVRGLSFEEDGNNSVSVESFALRRSAKVLDFLQTPAVQEKLLKPQLRGIVLLDVVGYSKRDTRGQAAILTLLNDTIQSTLRHQNLFSVDQTVEQIIPTGDGCYVVFHESLNERFVRVVTGIRAGLYCKQLRMFKKADLDISFSEKVQVTMACHLGEVDFFTDAAGNRNCYGDGMNDVARVLDLGKGAASEQFPGIFTAGTVFVSKEALPQAMFVTENLNKLYESEDANLTVLGTFADKHGFDHQISWLTGLSNNIVFPFHSSNEPEVQPIFYRA